MQGQGKHIRFPPSTWAAASACFSWGYAPTCLLGAGPKPDSRATSLQLGFLRLLSVEVSTTCFPRVQQSMLQWSSCGGSSRPHGHHGSHHGHCPAPQVSCHWSSQPSPISIPTPEFLQTTSTSVVSVDVTVNTMQRWKGVHQLSFHCADVHYSVT